MIQDAKIKEWYRNNKDRKRNEATKILVCVFSKDWKE